MARIQWTDAEKKKVLTKARQIRRKEPDLSPRKLADMAQRAVLPPKRQREHIINDPPYRLDWFLRGLEDSPAPAAVAEAAPPGPAAVGPPPGAADEGPPGADGEGPPGPVDEGPPSKGWLTEALQRASPERSPSGRKRKVFWTPHETEQILARAREIRDRTGLQKGRDLIFRAQRDVLPPDRWRDRGTLTGQRIDYMLAKIAEWPPFRIVSPETESEPVDPLAEERAVLEAERQALEAEKLRLALCEFAYPQAAAPEAAAPEAATPGDLDTASLISELAGRLFLGVQGGMTMLFEAVESLRRQQAEDHNLLLRMAADLDPKNYLVRPGPRAAAAEAAGEAAEALQETPRTPLGDTGFTIPGPLLQPPRASQEDAPRKPKICLVGGQPDWGREVVRAVSRDAEVVHEPEADKARNKGFKSFDVVYFTPMAGHSAFNKAKNDIGHQNVLRTASTGAAKIAEELRLLVRKRQAREAKAAGMPANGQSHGGRNLAAAAGR
jgi:hypothetical protein